MITKIGFLTFKSFSIGTTKNFFVNEQKKKSSFSFTIYVAFALKVFPL